MFRHDPGACAVVKEMAGVLVEKGIELWKKVAGHKSASISIVDHIDYLLITIHIGICKVTVGMSFRFDCVFTLIV